MDVEIIFKNGTIDAMLYGDIDHHTSQNIRATIDEAVQEKHPKYLNLDFKNVDFMDSSGIGLIMGRYKKMQTIGGQLLVVNVPRYIARVIRLSGLDQLGVLKNNRKKGEIR